MNETELEPLFKSEQGKRDILDLYEEKLESLDLDHQNKVIETSYGKTNVIITGNPKGPALILVHGSNGCAPIALETYKGLIKHYRVYAVDVLAQPTKSAPTRLSMKGDSYGKWMCEVIEFLGLQDITMAGFSFGGLIILKTLEYDESRVKEVFLSAPAYIVNGNPLIALLKVFIPMKKYMKSEDLKYLKRFLAELFTEIDEFAIKFLSRVFLEFEMDFSPVPTITKKNAGSITTPINLFAAENDVMFPGKKMIKRARRIFPSLRQNILLENSKHVQSKKQNEQIEKLILNSGSH